MLQNQDTLYGFMIRNTPGEAPEVNMVEFLNGIQTVADFRNMMESFLGLKEVNAGGRWLEVGKSEVYDVDTEADTWLILLRPVGHQVTGYKTTAPQWVYMKSWFSTQTRLHTGQGRPVSPLQPLGTWRKWARKVDAWI